MDDDTMGQLSDTIEELEEVVSNLREKRERSQQNLVDIKLFGKKEEQNEAEIFFGKKEEQNEKRRKLE